MSEAAEQRIRKEIASAPEDSEQPAVLPVTIANANERPPEAPASDDQLESPSVENKSNAADSWRGLILNRGDQLFVALVVSVMLVLMAVHWLRLSGWGLKPVEIERLEPLEYTFRVDVNKATWVEWAQLEGVGQVLARRIVEDREEHGPFASIDDVQRVKGIGPTKLEQLRPWLTLDESRRE